MPRHHRRPVLRNIAILAGSGLLERFLGALYRVALARAAGPVALGLLQFCLPILRLTMILGTLGLPQTLTRVVAEALARQNRTEARTVMAWSLKAVAAAGGMLTVLLLVLAPLGSRVFPDPRVVPLLRWLAPILFCDCLALIIQAGFQGQNRMWPVACAGLMGQVGKLVVGLILIRRAQPGGAGAVAGAALAAMAISELAALLFLAGLAGLTGRSSAGRGASPVHGRRSLLLSSLPLMGDGLVFAVAGTIDMMIIPRRLLHAGLARAEMMALIGQVWGMALPAMFLPMVAIWPIAAATLPVISAAAARNDLRELRRRIALTYAAVGAVSLLATATFLTGARPIVTILYACPTAAPYLRMLAWASGPIYLASIGATILIGLDRSALLFRQSLVCATLRVFLIYLLTGLPRFGIGGAIIGIAAGNALLALANIWAIRHYLCRPARAEASRQSPPRANPSPAAVRRIRPAPAR